MKNIFLVCSAFLFFHSLIAQSAIQNIDEHLAMCGPIPPVCSPISINTLGLGITFFSLGQISNTSQNNSAGGYQNFTCTDSTSLNQGDSYQVQVTTGQTYVEVIRVWIDFSNDGNFDSTELVFGDSATVYSHYGYAAIPISGPLGVPLRMRVGSEVDLYAPPDGCSNVQHGQYEDYTVYLNGPTGVSDLANKAAISISPNPLHTIAKLKIGNTEFGNKIIELKIYNTLGALVRSESLGSASEQEIKIDRNDLIEGLYFYELTINNFESIGSGKFVIE